jgi:1-aminocyclopropane-1-carboxylate deaminase
MEFNHSPLQEIHESFFGDTGVKVFVKRLDLMHPYISGNKWFKLKYNIEEAKAQSKDTILTFGGAYSNHILATAAVGKEYGLKTIGIIRGEQHLPLNPMLAFAKNNGMALHYTDRKHYRKKEDSHFIQRLKNRYGNFYLIPEGGANNLGVKGSMEIIKEIDIPFDYIACDCGTCTTIAGISLSLNKGQEAIGIPVLKGAEFLYLKAINLINDYKIFNGTLKEKSSDNKNFKLFYDYHFGGYAKSDATLETFIHEFQKKHGIPIEPVFSGKLFYAIYDLIKQGYFKIGSTIIILHSGGLGIKQQQ